MAKFLQNPQTGEVIEALDGAGLEVDTGVATYRWKRRDGQEQVITFNAAQALARQGETIIRVDSASVQTAATVTEADYTTYRDEVTGAALASDGKPVVGVNSLNYVNAANQAVSLTNVYVVDGQFDEAGNNLFLTAANQASPEFFTTTAEAEGPGTAEGPYQSLSAALGV